MFHHDTYQYNISIFSMQMERLRYGGRGFPFSIPMIPQQIPPSATSPPERSPVPQTRFYNPRLVPPLGIPTFSFSQEEVDSVLYGYTKNKTERCNGHALSGIRSSDLSHGKF